MVGETGVYIQNAVVRANSIFRKLADAGIDVSAETLNSIPNEEIGAFLTGSEGDELWSLVYLASRLPDSLRGAVSSLEPAHVAKWTFQLAQAFNVFDLPVVTVPAGRSKEGLPIGVQIVGRPFAEELVLAAAEIVEQVYNP